MKKNRGTTISVHFMEGYKKVDDLVELIYALDVYMVMKSLLSQISVSIIMITQ